MNFYEFIIVLVIIYPLTLMFVSKIETRKRTRRKRRIKNYPQRASPKRIAPKNDRG